MLTTMTLTCELVMTVVMILGWFFGINKKIENLQYIIFSLEVLTVALFACFEILFCLDHSLYGDS